MPVSDHVLALTLGSVAAGLLLLASPGQAGGAAGAHVQLQSGPLTLELGGPAYMRLGARADCLSRRCPLLNLSFEPSSPAQGAPGEARAGAAHQELALL